jgi:hypothetical protein
MEFVTPHAKHKNDTALTKSKITAFAHNSHFTITVEVYTLLYIEILKLVQCDQGCTLKDIVLYVLAYITFCYYQSASAVVRMLKG